MKKLVVLLFVIISPFVKGQMSDSLLLYYSYVNEAENSICETDYPKALLYYDTAFLYKEQPFAVDIYNTGVIYAFQKNNKSLYLTLKKIVNLGYPIESLQEKTDTIFCGFFKSKYGRKLIKYVKKPNLSYNKSLRETYDSLLVEDQSFRIKDGSYSLYSDTINKINKSNTYVIDNLIKKYGFPSEVLVGTHDFNYSPINMIIVHNRIGVKNAAYDYTPILTAAINTGEIDVRVGVKLLETSSGNYSRLAEWGGLDYYMIEDTSTKFSPPVNIDWGYIPVMDEKTINKIAAADKEREKIGLPSIDEARKRAIKSVTSPFIFLSGTLNGWVVSKKSYDRIMKDFILIE